jgi:hypothetical protein
MVSCKMNKDRLFCFLFAICVSFPALSQKVKYKDLFILLNAKQYDQAEPFLKKYLKDNDDNPNAYLFMAIIGQEKAGKKDVLKETEALIQYADSSIFFYGIAMKLITEKELKRNDEYYQMYNRRDLRTGDFGVKISDVQFDIEKRIQGLKEKKERVAALKKYYEQTGLLYSKATVQYKFLVSRYKNEMEFFLRADEKQSEELYAIIHVFDSCLISFNGYKTTSQLLGKTSYNQTLNLAEIKVFRKDGFEQPDFMADDLKLWDYKRWAENANTVVAKEINPMREQLITYDVQINKLRERLKKDSVSVNNDLKALVNRTLADQLKKFDPNPLPLQIFGMKMTELEYGSEVLHNRVFKDSVNAQFQVSRAKLEMTVLNKLDSVTTLLADRDLNADAENYSTFISSTYGTTSVLRSLVGATKEFAIREKEKKAKELLRKEEASKWLVVASDSIPITLPLTRETKFKPLIIIDESYTAGLMYADSIGTGYFYSITPSRVPDLKISFPVDKLNFTKRNLAVSKGLSVSDGKGQVYFVGVYSESKKGNKFPLTLAKIYRSDGLAWTNNYLTEGIPNELIFNSNSGEISIKISTGSGENKILTIDKNGKLIP